MGTVETIPAPDDYGQAASKLWREVTGDYSLRSDELVILGLICRSVDVLARLDQAMADAPLTVKGSMGQEREHPLLSEARQQRLTLARLIAILRLPDVNTTTGTDAGHVAVAARNERTAAARKAAHARWSR